MGSDDPPNYDETTLVEVPLDGLDPLKKLAVGPRVIQVQRYAAGASTRRGPVRVLIFATISRAGVPNQSIQGDARGGAQRGLRRAMRARTSTRSATPPGARSILSSRTRADARASTLRRVFVNNATFR